MTHAYQTNMPTMKHTHCQLPNRYHYRFDTISIMQSRRQNQKHFRNELINVVYTSVIKCFEQSLYLQTDWKMNIYSMRCIVIPELLIFVFGKTKGKWKSRRIFCILEWLAAEDRERNIMIILFRWLILKQTYICRSVWLSACALHLTASDLIYIRISKYYITRKRENVALFLICA